MSASRGGSVLAGEEPEEDESTPQPVKKEGAPLSEIPRERRTDCCAAPASKTSAAVIGEGEEPEEDETPAPSAAKPSAAPTALSSSSSSVYEKYEQEKLARGIKFESSGNLSASAALPSRSIADVAPTTEETPSSLDASVLKQLHKNEAIRKHLATALIHLYSHVNNSLVQVSVETTNTLNFTQDISHQLSETNDDLIQLQSKIPACTAWVNSFLAPAT